MRPPLPWGLILTVPLRGSVAANGKIKSPTNFPILRWPQLGSFWLVSHHNMRGMPQLEGPARVSSNIYIYIYIFFFFSLFTARGLHCCVQAFSSCNVWALLFIVVGRFLTEVASLVAEHGLQAHRLSSHRARA